MSNQVRDQDQRVTKERLRYLETTLQWHSLALDLMAEMSAIHCGPPESVNQASILDMLAGCLQQMVVFQDAGILLVQEDNSFELKQHWPKGDDNALRELITQLQRNGDFAWCLNNNSTLVRERDGKTILLNVVATRTTVHGVFVGVLPFNFKHLRGLTRLLPIILQNLANMLESHALHRLVMRQRDDLETTLKSRNRALLHKHHHDFLTGVLNRNSFIQQLERYIAEGCYQSVAVVYLDIDAFCRVNGSYGYSQGDEVLKLIVKRFQKTLDESALLAQFMTLAENPMSLARLGGDEFGFLIPSNDVLETSDITPLVNELIASLSEPFLVRGRQLYLTCSAGISYYPAQGQSADIIVHQADVAMQCAKGGSYNQFEVFNGEMDMARQLRSLAIEGDLRDALKTQQLMLCYQPRVDLQTEKVLGAEALLRWNHPQRGLIAPSEFIALAENSGLIELIGEWVLRQVCKQIKLWRSEGVKGIKISLNLSPRQMIQSNLIAHFKEILDQEAVSAEELELEVTETCITRDVDAAARILTELNRIGFSVAIDDFGTGYSSLVLLKRFPLNSLKIDYSFIHDLNRDPDSAAIVNAVIAMGHSLWLRVVAEGVETREQLHFLRSMGCHEVQGHYISKALEPDAFRDFFLNWPGID